MNIIRMPMTRVKHGTQTVIAQGPFGKKHFIRAKICTVQGAAEHIWDNHPEKRNSFIHASRLSRAEFIEEAVKLAIQKGQPMKWIDVVSAPLAEDQLAVGVDSTWNEADRVWHGSLVSFGETDSRGAVLYTIVDHGDKFSFHKVP